MVSLNEGAPVKTEYCELTGKEDKIRIEELNVFYGAFHAIKNLSMDIKANKVTAFIGPSGCGKSTCLKTLNRMNDLVDICAVKGKILLDGEDIYDPDISLSALKKKVGMVFQRPNPFPMSIYDNITYGPKIHGERDRRALDQIVEESLRSAALWDEVKDRLKKSAMSLSGGQQQRICIARALAVRPKVVLLDEPTSALDPISSSEIEETLLELKHEYTFIMVTHNLQQASRISDYTAFLMSGDLIEYGKTADMFMNPKKQITSDYLNGRFG